MPVRIKAAARHAFYKVELKREKVFDAAIKATIQSAHFEAWIVNASRKERERKREMQLLFQFNHFSNNEISDLC